jgi:EpsI family protein
MAKSIVRTGVFVLAMAVSIGAAHKLKPTPLYGPDSPPPYTLSQVVPERFGAWSVDPYQASAVVSPDLQATLETLYSETLSRTYVNPQGERIMLSLAYGADQSRSLQVHKPEVCYEAQGFKIHATIKTTTPTSQGPLPVMRVLTQKAERNEPVTYWIRMGDVIIRGWWEQNKARVSAGLNGHYPDGILVRVSSIDPDTNRAYALQDEFIKELVSALKPDGEKMLLGAHMKLASHNQH